MNKYKRVFSVEEFQAVQQQVADELQLPHWQLLPITNARDELFVVIPPESSLYVLEELVLTTAIREVRQYLVQIIDNVAQPPVVVTEAMLSNLMDSPYSMDCVENLREYAQLGAILGTDMSAVWAFVNNPDNGYKDPETAIGYLLYFEGYPEGFKKCRVVAIHSNEDRTERMIHYGARGGNEMCFVKTWQQAEQRWIGWKLQAQLKPPGYDISALEALVYNLNPDWVPPPLPQV